MTLVWRGLKKSLKPQTFVSRLVTSTWTNDPPNSRGRICSGAQIRVFSSISGFPAGDEAAVLESHASRIEELKADNAKHRMRVQLHQFTKINQLVMKIMPKVSMGRNIQVQDAFKPRP